MIHLYNNYYFQSDGARNIVLYKKTIVSADGSKGIKAKAENVGKEKYEVEGYYATLDGLLHGLSHMLMIDLLADKKIKDFQMATERLEKLMEDLAHEFKFEALVDGEKKLITARQIKTEA